MGLYCEFGWGKNCKFRWKKTSYLCKLNMVVDNQGQVTHIIQFPFLDYLFISKRQFPTAQQNGPLSSLHTCQSFHIIIHSFIPLLFFPACLLSLSVSALSITLTYIINLSSILSLCSCHFSDPFIIYSMNHSFLNTHLISFWYRAAEINDVANVSSGKG